MRRRRARTALAILGSLVVVLAIATAVGLTFAERWVNQRKDVALAEVSARIGRPVTAGRVDLGVLGGLRAEVRDVVVGRDPRVPAEPDPALRAPRARVRVAIFPTLLTFGRRIRVKEISVDGLTVEVVRYRDGRLNWQHVADRLAAEKKAPARAEKPDERVRHLRVGEAALRDARVRFVDLARRSSPAEVKDLDLSAKGLSLASSFEAQLSAALLAEEKNLNVRARFGETPSSGEKPVPPLEALVMKLAPTPLTPLVPFIRSLKVKGAEDLEQGTLAADLAAEARAHGGPAALKGFIALTDARFSRGKDFDARLDADVRADRRAGNLEVNRFTADVGGMTVEAHGRLANLRASPRFDGFTLESHGLDFTHLHAVYPDLDEVTGVVLRGPCSLQARGSSAGAEQRLVARVDLSPASIQAPGSYHKPAGTRFVLEANAAAAGHTIRFDRVTLAVADWHIDGQGRLETAGRGGGAARTFDASIDAPMVPVRELAALLAPRQAAGVPDVRVGAKVHARGRLGHPETMTIEAPSFSVSGGRSALEGRATVANLRAPRVELEGRARYLDLDDLLPPKGQAAPAQARAAAKPAGGSPLLARTNGTAKLDVQNGRAGGIEYRNLRADIALANGTVRARTLEVGTFGGQLSGSGSEVSLADPRRPFLARGRATSFDMATILAHFAGKDHILAGQLNADVDLRGRGGQSIEFRRSLTGTVAGRVSKAELLRASLLESIAKSLANAVKIPGFARLLGTPPEYLPLLRDRRLGDITGTLRLANGEVIIADALRSQTPAGALAVTGRIGLDGRANLNAALDLTPDSAAALTGGRVKPGQPIPVHLRITGRLSKPEIQVEDATGLARALGSSLLGGAPGQAPARAGRKPPQDQVRKAGEAARRALERAIGR